jgi:hypothetical protein
MSDIKRTIQFALLLNRFEDEAIRRVVKAGGGATLSALATRLLGSTSVRSPYDGASFFRCEVGPRLSAMRAPFLERNARPTPQGALYHTLPRNSRAGTIHTAGRKVVAVRRDAIELADPTGLGRISRSLRLHSLKDAARERLTPVFANGTCQHTTGPDTVTSTRDYVLETSPVKITCLTNVVLTRRAARQEVDHDHTEESTSRFACVK